MEIAGKVVLITGASAGIGLAAAREFARAGAKVALVARSAETLAQLADELHGAGAEAVAIPADMSQPEQARRAVEETVRHFGRLDVLINNAGQAAAGTVAELELENFQRIVALNVYGPLIAMQAAIPVMRAHGGGLIINVSSMVTKMRIPGLAAYTATKVALDALTETARGELAPENIRLITVYPRMTSTDFGKHSLGNVAMHERRRATTVNIPVDPPEHVAARILKAAIEEPEAQYMD